MLLLLVWLDINWTHANFGQNNWIQLTKHDACWIFEHWAAIWLNFRRLANLLFINMDIDLNSEMITWL